MKQAFAGMNPPYDPKLTVITVQKRHNTRFFQERLADNSPQAMNQLRNEKNVVSYLFFFVSWRFFVETLS